MLFCCKVTLVMLVMQDDPSIVFAQILVNPDVTRGRLIRVASTKYCAWDCAEDMLLSRGRLTVVSKFTSDKDEIKVCPLRILLVVLV